jgi:hypothetical protein
MKILTSSIAALAAIAMTYQAQASQVIITSPNQGQTIDAFSSIESRGLHWNARNQRLTAVITYSNKNYESPVVHPHDDTLAFSLPGVRYDQANNVFYAVSKDGQRTPVAKFMAVLFGKKIQLLPGAAIYAQQNHGDVSVKLLTGELDSNRHWIDIH